MTINTEFFYGQKIEYLLVCFRGFLTIDAVKNLNVFLEIFV